MKEVWNNTKKFVLNNLVVLSFALFVGFISVLPQILSIETLGDSYKGIPFLYNDSEYSYLSRIQEIKDGHWLASSPMFYEYKDYQVIVPPTAEHIYFWGSKLFFISIINFVYLSKFLFPAILFLLIYIFVYKLTENGGNVLLRRFNAIACGLFVTLGYDLFNYRNLADIFNKSDYPNFSIWTRLVNPISGAIFLFLFLIFIWEIMHRKRKFIVPSSVILFLMSGYIFSFGVAVIFLLIIGIIFVIKKEYLLSKDLFFIFLIFFAFLLIFLSFSFDLRSLADDPYRMGLFLTREPMLNKLLLFTSVFILSISFYFYKKKKYIFGENNWWLFLLSVIIASFIAYNQQLFTGMTVWPQHFVQYTIPLSAVILMVSLYRYFSNKKRLYSLFLLAIIFLNVFVGIKYSLTYKFIISDFLQKQRYGDLISWVDKNSSDECVIMSLDKTINYLVPALTHCDVYFYDWAFSGIPKDRILFNYLLYLRLKGVNTENIDAYLSSNKEEVLLFFYRNWGDLYLDNNDPWLNKVVNVEERNVWINGKIKNISEDLKKSFSADVKEEINKYRVDYVIMDGTYNSAFGGLKLDLIKEIDGFKIYKI